MKKPIIFACFIFLSICFTYWSCQKDNSPATTPAITDTQVGDAENISIVSNVYDEVDNQVQKALRGSLKSQIIKDTSITSTEDSTSTPENKTISWKKGLIDKELIYNTIKVNGKVVSGAINVLISYPKNGDTTDEKKWLRTITFDNYTVDGRKFEGTKTVTFKGRVDGTHPEWDITLTGGKVTLKNGKTLTFNYTRTRKMTEGYDSKVNTDNVFEINGTGSGTSTSGVSFTTADSNLVKVNGCPFYKSGSITNISNKKTTTIYYNGGSSCSPTATIEANGKVKSINTDTESK